MVVLCGLVALFNGVSLLLQFVAGWFLSKNKIYTSLSRVKILLLAAGFVLQCVVLRMLSEILFINILCAILTFLWLVLSIVEYIIIRKSYKIEEPKKVKNKIKI